jgi:hypothetical protein
MLNLIVVFFAVTASWYRPAELPVRLGVWYSATWLFTIFSGLVNYAIDHSVRGGLAPRKYMKVLIVIPCSYSLDCLHLSAYPLLVGTSG